jgi:ABC-2 family transporter protein
MIWLTWRQFRTQALVGAVLLAVVAAALLATAPGLFDRYHDSGFAGCATGCAQLAQAFTDDVLRGATKTFYRVGVAVLFLLPALVGVFWGAPLVARELEAGTHRLVWSQTITRSRWLIVKLTGVGLAVILLTGLISLLVTWWSGPIDEAQGDRITPLLFAARGVVPLGHAALAFVLGVLTGLIARRAVLAMGITLLLVAAVQIAVPTLIRPLLASPVSSTAAFDPERIDGISISNDSVMRVSLQSPVAGAWVLSNRTVDARGDEFRGPVDRTKCGREGSPEVCEGWLQAQNLRQEASYVPPGQFWSLQWRELGVLAALTVLIAMFSFWWLRRRTT